MTAFRDIDVLLHGDCPAKIRDKIFSAVTQAFPHLSQGHQGSIRPLSLLTSALPSLREQLASPDHLAVALTATAVADPSLFMMALTHYTLCGGTLVHLGPPASANRHLARMDSGDTRGVYLITEIGSAGSQLHTQNQAVYEPSSREFLLTTPHRQDAKFSSVAPQGGPCLAVVFARLIHQGTDHGVYPFAVPLTDQRGLRPGVQISGSLGLDALPLHYGLIQFDRVRIPYEDWLCGPATFENEQLVDPRPRNERLPHNLAAGGISMYAMIPSALAAVSRISSLLALRYSACRSSHARLAPGVPLLTYAPQQVSLFAALAESMALTCVARRAVNALNATDTSDPTLVFGPWTSIDPDLAMYKAVAAEAAVRVTSECRERCGLHGLLNANRINAYQNLAQVFTPAGGDNRLILLDTGMALAEADELPRPPAATDEITSPHWWPAICRSYRHRLAATLRTTLKARGHLDGLKRWNPLLEDAIALGRAHGAYLAAHAFAETVEGTRDPVLRATLSELASLYGITQARRLSGPLMTSGILSFQTSRLLTTAASTVCDRLAGRLPLLYQLTGFPRSFLTSPMTSADYAAALSDLTWTSGGPP